jgi:ParB family transcriptional regulator, chromosome partitioning protein
MAKRRRLSALPFLSAAPTDAAAQAAGIAETAPAPIPRPPIAQVAGEAAASSALHEMAERFERARAEGRMIQPLALDAIEADYLVRDRLGLEAEGQAALVASIRARGQQVPVEVVALGQGRYGLISGWRRLAALRALHEQTGEDRFATALAILRRPADAPAAYLAMVEENEIRVGLSYYERARIVARAVEAGVFADDTAALQTLFAAASRPRRSKIGSFLRIVRALDETLRFPAAIPERLGLRLSAALQEDAALAARIAAELRRTPPETAEAELALLDRLAAPAAPPATAAPEPKAAEREAGAEARAGAGQGPATGERAGAAPPPEAGPGAPAETPADTPTVTYEPERGRITLTGPGIDAALARRLRAWLAEGQG